MQPSACSIGTVFLLAFSLAASGCISHTDYGPCIGLNGTPRADLRYEYSERNIVLGIIGFEIVAPPVIVLLEELKCPVGRAGGAS